MYALAEFCLLIPSTCYLLVNLLTRKPRISPTGCQHYLPSFLPPSMAVGSSLAMVSRMAVSPLRFSSL